MTVAYIALGANLGNRRKNLISAIEKIKDLPQTKVVLCSSFHRTQPVGGPTQPWFLNGVVKIKTDINKLRLLKHLLYIENQMGRTRTIKWGPRTIDLDLLVFGSQIFQSRTLTIPHPRYHERIFVLAPFCEIAAGFIHPRLRKTNRTLLKLAYASHHNPKH